MIYEIAILTALAALWQIGFSKLFDQHMIFEKPGQWLEWNVPMLINKPLWYCPHCMSSVHGGLIWIIAGVGPWYCFPVFSVAVCGIVTVAYMKFEGDKDVEISTDVPKEISNHHSRDEKVKGNGFTCESCKEWEKIGDTDYGKCKIGMRFEGIPANDPIPKNYGCTFHN